MQKLFLKLTGLAILITAIFVSGCQEDDPIITNPLPPVARLLAEAGFISSDAEIAPGEVFKVKLDLQTGDNPLQSVNIYIDGAKLATDKFEVNGGAITSNNPFLITGADKNGVIYEISITAEDHVNMTHTYQFEVIDDKQEKDDVSIDITTKGTPITTLTGVLFNRAGPTGTGGLDLDEGIGTGTTTGNYQEAEIKDEGIDQSLPQATNWKRQISGINGSVVRILGAGTPEGFKFDDVTTLEAIVALYDDGEQLPNTNTQGERVSAKLVVGDVLTVKRDDNYYLIRVDEVNEVHIGENQPGNNDDNYVFSIKRKAD